MARLPNKSIGLWKFKSVKNVVVLAQLMRQAGDHECGDHCSSLLVDLEACTKHQVMVPSSRTNWVMQFSSRLRMWWSDCLVPYPGALYMPQSKQFPSEIPFGSDMVVLIEIERS